MAEHPGEDLLRGDRDGGISDLVASIYSYFGVHPDHNSTPAPGKAMEGSSLPVADASQEANGAQNACSLEKETEDGLSENECVSGTLDLASALGSEASGDAWDFGRMTFPVHKLLSVLGLYYEGSECSSPSTYQNEIKGATDPVEDEVSFQSKYLNVFPLYQQYCLETMKAYLPAVNHELVTAKCLQSVKSSLSHYVNFEVIVPQQQSSEVTTFSPPPRFLRETLSTFWQDLDEVKECGLLARLTPREVHLQEAMFEVIGSEASYLRSLGVAVNHFYASKTLKQTLSRMEHHVLFSNLWHVMAASEKFLMDLEKRLGKNVVISEVGDIVLRHSPTFRALYVPYVTNMMYQEALVTQLLQENKSFAFALKKLENEAVCQRQSLKSFLVLPFQRITRLKLLMENILKLTQPDADSFSNLQKAIKAIHEIMVECNDGVQKMKRIEELVCLEMLLDFSDVKAIPLIASGRFLVRQGPLRQLTLEGHNSRMSFLEVHLHLFNDLLIISLNKEHRFTVTDHAAFPAHVHVEQLKTGLLGLPSESFLLRLSRNHSGHPTALILVAHARSEKEAWMKVLSSNN